MDFPTRTTTYTLGTLHHSITEDVVEDSLPGRVREASVGAIVQGMVDEDSDGCAINKSPYNLEYIEYIWGLCDCNVSVSYTWSVANRI